jgi:hemerythrin
MPVITWNDSLLLGIDQFDDHHRHLVSLINLARESWDLGDHGVVSKLLNELVDYATYHFSAEEFWMKEQSYPLLEVHSKEHEEFCIKVVEQELLFEAGETSVLPTLVEFLSTWLIEHIQKSDGAYGVYARSIGASHDYDRLAKPSLS